MSRMEVVVDQINVNAGDSALICFYKDEKLEKAILVDAGTGDAGQKRVLPFLKNKQEKLGSLKLDAVVVTHYDQDHMGGVTRLLKDKRFTAYLKDSSSKTLFYDPGQYKNETDKKTTESGYDKYKEIIEKLEAAQKIQHMTPFSAPATNNILGHELFWNEAIDLKGGFATGIANLTQKNKRYEDNPALLCVAVNKSVADIKDNYARFSPIIEIVVSGGSTDATTDKNQRSIALILVSPKKEILHYLGGDLGETIEEEVVKWLSQGYKGRFKAMKFSHHGAKYSTPTNLITRFRPEWGVVSAGRAKHNHPSLELLFYIMDWNDTNSQTQTPILDFILLECTNAPDYLETSQTFVKAAKAIDYNAMKKIISSETLKQRLEIFKTKDDQRITQQYQFIQGIWNALTGMEGDEIDSKFFPTKINKRPIITSVTIKHDLSSDSTIATDKFSQETEFKSKAQTSTTLMLLSPILTENKITYRIGSSKLASDIKADIRLSKDCDLDIFVNNLKSMCLTLMMAQAPDPRDLKLNGIIIDTTIDNQPVDFFGTWLKQTLAMIVTLEMARNIKDGALVVNSTDMTMTVAWEEKQLVSDESKKTDLTGSLKNGIFEFGFQSGTMPTTLGLMSKLAGYSRTSSELLDLLTGLLGVDIKPSTQMNVVFDPQSGWNYFTRLNLNSSFPDSTLKLGPVTLSKPTLVFNSQISPSRINFAATIADNIIEAVFQRYSASISASLEIGSLPACPVTLLIQSNGWSKITFKPTIGIIEEILAEILQAFGFGEDKNIIQNFAKNFGFTLPNINFVSITFAKLKFVSVTIGVQLQIYGQLLLDVYCSFPEKQLWGGLSDSKGTETGIDEEISSTSFQTLLTAYKIDAPDSSVGILQLANIYFSADFSNNNYSIEAVLRSPPASQPSKTAWQFSDEIQLTDLDITLSYADKQINFSLEAILTLRSINKPEDTSLVILTGQYDHSSGWQFGTNISQISLYQLLDLLPKDDGIREGLTELLPDVTLNNIQLTLNTASKTFSFSGELNILGLSKTQLNFVLFGGSSGAKRYILSLGIPCLSLFDNIAFLKNIPSPLKAVQFMLASKQPLSASDDLSSFANLTLNKDQIKPGVTLLFTINGVAEPILLPLYTKKVTLLSEVSDEKSADPETPIAYIWKKLELSLGILTLNRIGLGYHQQRLHLLFDSTLQLGILSFQLLGLGVNFKIDQPSNFGFELSGLGLDYATPEFSLAGDFLKDSTITEERYLGDIILKIPALSLSAIGAYSKNRQNGDTSVFVFARLSRELGGPPFAIVMGLAAGFGYNQALRIPTMDEVAHFPLVQGAVNPAPISPDDLGTQLRELFSPSDGSAPWLQREKDQYWLALGIDFTTFNLMSTRTLAVVEFGQDFQLAILGRSCMQLPIPPTNGISDSAILYAELGLEAVFNPGQGTLAMSALLSPNSFVLTRSCHLTGGFAFNMWFKDQANGARAGDFVVTLGGYHPDFSPPSWYPRVPRLGFNWQVNDYISIEGESYCALTPSAVMAGGLLQALFQDGDLNAWFKAHGDFLIEWHPIHFEASIGVCVGASYHLNLLFTSFTISAEIGVDLKLYGPPLGGEVKIDWYIISFSIHFGADNDQSHDKTWQQFRQFLFKAAAPALINKIIIEKGLLHQEKNDGCWFVRPHEFSFSTESIIPITKAKMNNHSLIDNEADIQDPLYIKPMSDKPNDRLKNSAPSVVRIDEHTHKIDISTPGGKPVNWQYQFKKRYLPSALWGDPMRTQASLITDSTLLPNPCSVGITVQAPPSILGSSPGVLSIDTAFSTVPIGDPGQIPFTAASTVPDLTGKRTPHSRKTIQDTIATTPAQQKRQQLTSQLQQWGLFARGVTLDSMQDFAAQTHANLLEPTMLAQAELTRSR